MFAVIFFMTITG